MTPEQRTKAEADIRKFAGTYSDAVELGEDGKLRWTRDVKAGEVVAIPAHMFGHAERG